MQSLSESLPFICVGLKNVLEYQEGKCTVNGTANGENNIYTLLDKVFLKMWPLTYTNEQILYWMNNKKEVKYSEVIYIILCQDKLKLKLSLKGSESLVPSKDILGQEKIWELTKRKREEWNKNKAISTGVKEWKRNMYIEGVLKLKHLLNRKSRNVRRINHEIQSQNFSCNENLFTHYFCLPQCCEAINELELLWFLTIEKSKCICSSIQIYSLLSYEMLLFDGMMKQKLK